ncbi:MAG: Os1348 family NHLP clan protein [Thermodesulfobacteriota bacterium]
MSLSTRQTEEKLEDLLRQLLATQAPSQNFRDKLGETLSRELEACKTGWIRRWVIDAVIGRALSDLKFRHDLLEDPAGATSRAGFILFPAELAAFKDMSEEMMETFSGALDQRISKKVDHGLDDGPASGA